MTHLTRLVHDTIAAQGPISVAQFMQIALQHPDGGYYTTGDPLGRAGDFITAPEISQMFGEMIGLWLAQMWREAGSPTDFTLLELGAGRGTLMLDALRATQHVEGFHAAAHLTFLESSQTLRAMQMELLAAYNPTHVDSLDELPARPVFMIANEFLDAMPIHQYVRTPHGWRERMVDSQQGSLVYTLAPHDPLLPLPETLDFFEVSPTALTFVKQIARRVAKDGGAALWIDYGYAMPGGVDTFQAVSGHDIVSPLARVGAVDLTAHVDFEAVRIASEREGAKPLPLMTQGDFLRSMGIELRAAGLAQKASESQSRAIDIALTRLTGESEMGNLFKVLGVVGFHHSGM